MKLGRGRTPKLFQLCFLILVLTIAIIGTKSSKTSPIPPARPSSPVDRPVTRSKAPNPATNLVSKHDVMSEYASAESVQALQAAVTAMQTEGGVGNRDAGHSFRDGAEARPLEDPAISWQQFKQRYYLRFGPGLRGNAFGTLNIRQNGRPVDEYTDEFQETLGRTTAVRQDQVVDLYTAGLDEWLRIDIEHVHPLNLDVAMNLACSYARRQLYFSPSAATHPSFFPFAGGPPQPQPRSQSVARTGPPMSAAESSANSPSFATPKPAASASQQSRFSGGARSAIRPPNALPAERRLSRSEYQHRRSKGLCFHCDEPWSPAQNCRHLFLLVIDDEAPIAQSFAPVEPDVENPKISLHAITGTGSGNTMRVTLRLNNSPITALKYSGSTHNFVNLETAKKFGLLIRACPYLAVANGEQITGLGICEDVMLQKDTSQFPVNLFVIPLVGNRRHYRPRANAITALR
nr:retrotransposon protein, putative, unclassified [Ipomoea batatas]